MNTKNRLLLIEFYFKICMGTKRNYIVDELRTPYTYDVKNGYNTYRDLNFEHCAFDGIVRLNASKDSQSTVKNINDAFTVELPNNGDCCNLPYLSKEGFNDNSILKTMYDGFNTSDNIIYSKDYQLDQGCSILTKKDFDESEEILKHLDNSDFVEPSKKELDECSPAMLDFDSLDELLNGKQEVMPTHNNYCMQLQVDLQSNSLKSLLYDISDDKSKRLTSDTKEDDKNEFNRSLNSSVKILTSSEHGENFLKFDTNFFNILGSKDFSLTLQSFIEKFICENLSCSFNSIYLTRLKSISEGFKILDSYKINCKNDFYKFNFSDDSVLVEKLIDINKSFDQSSGFNQETYDKFSEEFDRKIFDKFYSFKFWREMDKSSVYQKKLLFYVELMKHYKIVFEIPEILIIGGIYEDKTFFNLPFIMHSINLFAEKIGNIKNNKVFILCLIYKAFKCIRNNLFDIFLIPYYGFLCNKSRHDLTFFTWELNTRKRQSITRRKTRVFEYNYNDEKYLKTIFLIYLYQYLLFIKYYNINSKNLNQFKRFVDKVIQSEKCLGCLFEEFLNIMNIINKEVFQY